MNTNDSFLRALSLKRSELSQRLSRITADIHHHEGPVSADFAEQAVERENDEVLDRICESTQAELNAVERSLQRLANGTYGKCQHCGAKIEASRMAARPEAETCVDCAE